MKNISIIILAGLFSVTAFGQDIIFGAQLGLGVGSLKTTSLTTYFDAEVSDEQCVKHYSLREQMGFAYSIGGFLEFGLSDKLAVESGISFQSAHAELITVHIQDKVNREITDSKNIIIVNSLHIPILAKFYFTGGNGPYALGGLGLDFVMSAKIKTDETVTEETYSGSGDLIGTANTVSASVTADLDGFSKMRTSLIIGAGMLLDVGNNGISVDLRYSLPMTKSEMYTSDSTFDNSTEKSDVFGITEQNEIASDGYALDDFKMGVIMLKIGYRL